MAHCLRKNRGLGQISCKQLAFELLWVIETDFLLTISTQYQVTSDDNEEKNIYEGIISWSNTKSFKLTP